MSNEGRESMPGMKEVPILVELETTIKDGSRQEKTTVQANGTLTPKGETTYIRYDEEMPEVGHVRNMIRVGQNEATIIRNGAVKMRQRFRQGMTTEGQYESPVGVISMETTTKRFDYERGSAEGIGRLNLVYHLMLQGQQAGQFELTMKLKEVSR
jgi:uncharacterized beta-barrel protein YwiB (DUF1934 family)